MKAPRRRLHRTFVRWLKANRSRFAIPLRILRRTDEVLRFSFDNVTSLITGRLSTWDLSIYVHFNNTDWDLIFDAYQKPRPVPGGYICGLCLPGFQKVFPSREAVWTDHLCEGLLAWVNDELAIANWLVLEGKPGHVTSARLASERSVRPLAPDSDWIQIVVPLRSSIQTDVDDAPPETPLEVHDRRKPPTSRATHAVGGIMTMASQRRPPHEYSFNLLSEFDAALAAHAIVDPAAACASGRGPRIRPKQRLLEHLDG